MKTLIMVLMFALLATIANAETYKWEDANGVHFTDNPNSVPAQYRERQLPETKDQIKDTSPQAGLGIAQQNGPNSFQPVLPPVIQPAIQKDQAAIDPSNLEQQRRATEAMRRQQARALAASTRSAEAAANSIAKFMATWLLIGFLLFVIWVSTIVDIVRSDFVSNNKTVWMLLVIFVPLLGMALYFVFGHGQKCKTSNFGKNDSWRPGPRTNQRGVRGNDYNID